MTHQELVSYYDNSAVKVAAALGVSVTTVNNWAKKEKLPTMVQLAAQTITKNKLVADKDGK